MQAIQAAARAAYALNPTPEVPVSAFNVQGGLTFANGGLYNTPKNNLMPRVGFTYKLGDKTVARGGYGVYYGFLGQRRGDVFQSGFSANTTLIPSLDNGLTFVGTLSNPFPNGITEPVGSAQGIATFLGQSVTFFDPNPKSPRMQRWQVGVQRELPGRWMAEVGYVGNYGSNIQTSRNLNATPNQYLSTSPVRDQTTINYLGANVPNPFFGLLPTTAAAALQGHEHRARAAAPSVSAVRRRQHDDQRRPVVVQRAAAQPAAALLEWLHGGLDLHLLEGHRSVRVPERGRCRPVERASRRSTCRTG